MFDFTLGCLSALFLLLVLFVLLVMAGRGCFSAIDAIGEVKVPVAIVDVPTCDGDTDFDGELTPYECGRIRGREFGRKLIGKE